MIDDTEPPEETPGIADSEFGGAPEISRRVGSILDAVEREAQRLREEAREEANRYLEHAKRRADGLVAERQRRIALVSDELLAKSEAVVGRLDDAAPVQQGFKNLVRALGDAAERLARETEASSSSFEARPFHEVAGQIPAPSPSPADEPEPEPSPPQPFAAHPFGHRPPDEVPENGGADHPAGEPAQPFAAQPHPARAPSSPNWQSPPVPASSRNDRGAPGLQNWRQIDDARMVAIQMATTGATRAGVREHLNRELGVGDTAAILDEIFGSGTGEDAQVPWIAGSR